MASVSSGRNALMVREFSLLLQLLVTSNRKPPSRAWGEDGSTPCITAHEYLCRLRTKMNGAGFCSESRERKIPEANWRASKGRSRRGESHGRHTVAKQTSSAHIDGRSPTS